MVFLLFTFFREHPFNLKVGGWGWGALFFIGVKNKNSLRSAAEFFFRDIILFSTKTTIFKAQSANRIFFLPISETENFFKQICRQNCLGFGILNFIYLFQTFLY